MLVKRSPIACTVLPSVLSSMSELVRPTVPLRTRCSASSEPVPMARSITTR